MDRSCFRRVFLRTGLFRRAFSGKPFAVGGTYLSQPMFSMMALANSLVFNFVAPSMSR